MDHHHDDSSRSPERTDTQSREHRTRLLTKLNCLIAVLEVAIAKIGRSLEAPDANQERLKRVRANLENTLAICHRAKRTLNRSLDGRARRAGQQPGGGDGMGYRDYVELSSIDEYRKFKSLPPIDTAQIEGLDIDDLARRLGDL